MRKKYLLAALLILSVGFAAVSTTLYINGTSTINSNDKDFKVYYSDAKVNGTQDLSVVVDETHLSFTTTLDTLGETYVLDYDVTNGSKNYDAALTMNCTGGNDYLTVINNFDIATNLAALQTRSGKLTLALTKSYTGDDLDVTITCTLNANAVERNSLGEGSAASPVEPSVVLYAIGDEITIAGETFNVINQTEESLTLLTQYNIDQSTLRQNDSTDAYSFPLSFSSMGVWGDAIDIDVQQMDGKVPIVLNQYVEFISKELNDETITGNVITLEELKKLECDTENELTCNTSQYTKWLVNNQRWYTRTAYSDSNIWIVEADGDISHSGPTGLYTFVGLRPIIVVNKEILENYLNS